MHLSSISSIETCIQNYEQLDGPIRWAPHIAVNFNRRLKSSELLLKLLPAIQLLPAILPAIELLPAIPLFARHPACYRCALAFSPSLPA